MTVTTRGSISPLDAFLAGFSMATTAPDPVQTALDKAVANGLVYGAEMAITGFATANLFHSESLGRAILMGDAIRIRSISTHTDYDVQPLAMKAGGTVVAAIRLTGSRGTKHFRVTLSRASNGAIIVNPGW